jgi:hypothetical protein
LPTPNRTIGFTGPPMLHPNQFEVNEAWIVFQLNEAPVRTDRDGAFNCIALMDAASCFIFDMVMVAVGKSEPSRVEVRRLFKKAWGAKRQYPHTLLVPAGRFQSVLPAEAERQGISVVPVHESQLLVFIGEAQQGFKEHLQSGGAASEA